MTKAEREAKLKAIDEFVRTYTNGWGAQERASFRARLCELVGIRDREGGGCVST